MTGISHSPCQQTCQFPLLLDSAPPSLPMEIPWGQSQPATAALCAPSHEQKHQPPTCAMNPAPRMGLAEGSRSRAMAALTPARSRAQLVPEHGQALTGATPEPSDTQRGHSRPVRPGAAGAGLQQDALRGTGLGHRSSCWKRGVRARHFLPSAASPTQGLAGGQGPEPPPLLSSLGARSPLWQVLHPPRAPQTGRSPLEQGGL